MIPVERYRSVPLFQGLTHDEIAGLLREMDDLEVEPGQQVIREGAPSEGLYVVAAGAFEVRRRGRDEPLARLEELAHFGDMALVTERSHKGTVTCVEAGRLKRLATAKFAAMIARDDLVAYKLVLNICRIMAERLDRLAISGD